MKPPRLYDHRKALRLLKRHRARWLDERMRWSALDCKFSSHPRKCTASRREFIKRVLTPTGIKRPVPEGESAKHFAGAVSPNLPTKDGKRSKRLGSGAEFTGFDFDNLSDELRDGNLWALENNGIAAVARTTTSHGAKAEPGFSRCRIMILLSRPLVDWLEYDRMLAWAAEFLDGTPDPACEHAAALFYRPLKGVAEEREWCWLNLDGEPLDVDHWLDAYPIGKKSEAARAKRYGSDAFCERGATAEEQWAHWEKCSKEKREFLIDEALRFLEAHNVMWQKLKPEGGVGRFDQAVSALRICNEIGVPLAGWIEIVLNSKWNREQEHPLTPEYVQQRNLMTILDHCQQRFGHVGDDAWEKESRGTEDKVEKEFSV